MTQEFAQDGATGKTAHDGDWNEPRVEPRLQQQEWGRKEGKHERLGVFERSQPYATIAMGMAA